MGVQIKFWQTLRKLRKVGKIRGQIELPTFSEPCGWLKSCLDIAYHPTFDLNLGNSANALEVTTNFTLECWIKREAVKGSTTVKLFDYKSNALVRAYKLDIVGSLLSFALTNTTPTTYTLDQTIPINEWFHFAVTFEQNAFIKLYLNGVLVETQAVSNNPIRISAGAMRFFLTLSDTYPVKIAHLRYWNSTRSSDQILNNMFRRLGPSTGLLASWPMTQPEGDTTVTDIITGAPYNFNIALIPEITFDDTDGIVTLLGASFAAAYALLSTDRSFSFQFPIDRPADPNFTPVVSFQDDEGDVKYYKLWEGVDLDFSPPIPLYNGEAIPSGAFLYIFNIDGNQTVDLETAITMLTSILHIVTDPTTTARTTDATLTIATTLGADLPLIFPFSFDTELTFD